MQQFTATLRIKRLDGALDPEAKAIENVLIQWGFPIVPNSLKQSRELIITFGAVDENAAREAMEKFLGSRVNPSLDKGEVISVRPAD